MFFRIRRGWDGKRRVELLSGSHSRGFKPPATLKAARRAAGCRGAACDSEPVF